MSRKVLFVHDGPILCDSKQEKFYAVHYNDSIIKRYSFFGDHVTFLMRHNVISDEDAKNHTKISYPLFNYINVPNFKSILSYHNKSKAKGIINNAIQNHDIIILRLPSAIGSIAFEYAKELGKPILIEMVACVYDALWNYDWRGKLIAKSKMIKYQNILSKSTHVVYVTKEFLQERYPTDGRSIGCSDVVLKEIDKSIIKKRIKKISNSREILTLGTVAAIDVPYKGQDDVLKTIAELRKEGIEFNYKIVGQGNPKKLNRIIKELDLDDCVDIIGSLPHEKVFDFLDQIDLYIQPSKQEGLPRSVVEAMSRACPIIGSDLAGIPELISEEALFKPGNRKELKNLLKSIDKQKMEKWAYENFKNSENFNKNLLDKNRMDFYNEFMIDNKLLN